MRAQRLFGGAAAAVLAAVLAAQARSAYVYRPEGFRAAVGDSGWSMIVPKGWTASGWQAPPPTAGRGYFASGPFGGSEAFSRVSQGTARSKATRAEDVSYVEHEIVAEIVTIQWPPGKPPVFMEGFCGKQKLRAPPVRNRTHGRMNFAFDCGEETWTPRFHQSPTGRQYAGESGSTASSHFIVVLGTTSWTPYTAEWYRQSMLAIHLRHESRWSNVFDRGAVSYAATALADFRKLCLTLEPRKGDETPPPSAANAPEAAKEESRPQTPPPAAPAEEGKPVPLLR